MVDIDSRPDLTELLVKLDKYTCKFTSDDQIIVKLPDFKWYGISLNCMNISKINTYLVIDETSNGTVYLGTFYDMNDLDTIIKESVKEATICKKCGKDNASIVVGPNVLCNDCYNKIKRK